MKQSHLSDKKLGKDLSIKEGQTFIPFNTFIGGFLPEPIMETDILTGTEKVCWAKLSQFAGRDGYCYPSLSFLAKSIGVSVRQVNRVVKGLVDKKFIKRVAPSRFDMIQGRTTTRYYFLWHACFNDALLKNATHASTPSNAGDTNVMDDTAEDTKNGEARTVYLDDELKSIIHEQSEMRKKKGVILPYVFLNRKGGDRIKRFDKVWSKACKDAKIGKRFFHDFRRTAVRNMVRSGIPEVVAMKISGHKTKSVFDRYNITSESDLKDASRKLASYLDLQNAGTISGTIEDFCEKVKL